MTNLEIKTPDWMEPIFGQHYRYLAIRGGRGSGKSHAMAEYFIERSVMERFDLVCAREFQSSLGDSVKKLLEDKIQHLGVPSMFEVQRDCIKSKNGGRIVFKGIADSTADALKSLEGFDALWYEEAQVCSQRSLDLIRPTFRKPGSQLVFTWNPRFDTDPIDKFFLGGETPPGALNLEVNYMDNPWFSDEMRDEMEYDKERDIDKYNHIWLGQYIKNSEARIFRNWKIEEFETPPGAMLRLGADFGFSNDPTTLVRCFLEGRKLYIEYEAYMHGCEVHDTAALFMSVPDSEKWPIVADSSRPETISYLKKHGFPAMLAAVKGPRSVEEGIKWLKSHEIIVHPRCKNVIEEMTMYKYKENKQTGEIYPIPEDKNNHCIAEGVLITCERGDVPIEQVTLEDKVLTRGGYRKVLFSDITDVNRKILRVETTGGTIFCTPDHEIWTENGFIRADILKIGDETSNLKENIITRGRVLTVTEHGVSERVYDLTVEEHHEFFANGVLVSNCIDALRYACEGLRRAHAVEDTKRKYQSVHIEPIRNPFANRYKKG